MTDAGHTLTTVNHVSEASELPRVESAARGFLLAVLHRNRDAARPLIDQHTGGTVNRLTDPYHARPYIRSTPPQPA